MPLTLVEGLTEALDFDLLADGVTSEGGLSSDDTVELILKSREGIRISTTGNVSLEGSTSEGYFFRYAPDAGDLVAKRSPYAARFKVTRTGKVFFAPSAEPDEWVVYEA